LKDVFSICARFCEQGINCVKGLAGLFGNCGPIFTHLIGQIDSVAMLDDLTHALAGFHAFYCGHFRYSFSFVGVWSGRNNWRVAAVNETCQGERG
jgi:hypothetical protein